MSLVSLKAELRQQLKLSPHLLQSMEILQMTSQELLEYLGRLTEENPLLEPEDGGIIWTIRLPRVLAAAILGGALAVSGFLLQTFSPIPLRAPLFWAFPRGPS